MNSPGNAVKLNLLLSLSLVFNVCLAVAIARGARHRAGSQHIETTLQKPGEAASTPLPASLRTAVRYVTNASLSQLLDWRGIESQDYKQYAANLRAVGVPEQVVRDIVIADLSKMYGARIMEIRGTNTNREYWQRYEPVKLSSTQTAQLKALDEERRAAFRDVLGVEISSQTLLDEAFMQLSPYASSISFLPEEKRAAAESAFDRATKNYDYNDQNYDRRQRREYAARVAELEKLLSPDEMDEYRLRHSPIAERLRTRLGGFAATPEEFRAMLAAREGLEKENGTRFNAEQDGVALKTVLGEQRYEEFKRQSDHAWRNAAQVAEREGLPPEAVNRAYEAKIAAEAEMARIRADKTLTSAQRAERVAAVKASSEQNVRAALGDSGFNRYKGRGGIWMQNLR